MQKKIIVILILSIIIAVFAILNAKAVPINLIFLEMNVSVALIILISASLGAIIVYFIDTHIRIKNNKKYKSLEKESITLTSKNQELTEVITEQQKEIAQLKEELASLSLKNHSDNHN
ncbi:lipopolysaccharide assembly protein LapA domain-containing protein [Alkaliphilus serpentinus]|uniref:DUF1049 domain-containing protein n=1 Tax=Alkaliphilus serpentinus TaxID=1482731 RepID=A0A833HR72_9FIRM|nr:LapA family protein [Alkaliphilus serpentinus]KAB3532856.1 DUF1049 domain-containing protein [Alkaliphilus serpentinus]